MHAGRRTARSPTATSPNRPPTQVGAGYVRRVNPASTYREETLTQTHSDAAPFAMPLQEPVLTKAELAGLLRVSVTWVTAHSNEIPGVFRIGSMLRFRRVDIENWLGGLSHLLLPEDVAGLLRVQTNFVYYHADKVPGVLRLGRYIRFRPTPFHAFLNGSEA